MEPRAGDPAGASGPLVLVGMMGAGKSTVGRHLARSCGRRFVDLDEEIVRRSGRTVAQLFDELGEARFRELEADATRALAAEAARQPRLIVSAGGGWMTNADARAALPDARTVWLRVGAAEAARRLAADSDSRPLLDGDDPVGRLEALLTERLPAYGEATYTVETEGRTPEAVVRAVAALVDLPLECVNRATDFPDTDTSDE